MDDSFKRAGSCTLCGMPETTSAAARTRRAILEAGAEVLMANAGASLSDIAATAGVARSTLHRYFPDRGTLTNAIEEMTAQEYVAAVRAARLDQGTGLEAFQRLCSELLNNAEVLAWWMRPGSGDGAGADARTDVEWDAEDRQIAAVIARGHKDGTLDAQLSTEWIVSILWATMYSSHYMPACGAMNRLEAQQQALRTLLKATAADPSTI